jgi:sarcosine oxidase subunit gamma
MAEPVWESALAGARAEGTSIEVSETEPRMMIDLRLAPDDAEGRAAAGAALGLELPTAPRTSADAGGVSALWLSIDQWLVVGSRHRRAESLARMEAALAGRFSSVTDLSDARTVLRLEGRGARETVMKGGAADLLGADFRPGSARRLTFAGIAAMVVHAGAEPERLELYVHRSCSDYALRWLEAAAVTGAEVRLFAGTAPPPV